MRVTGGVERRSSASTRPRDIYITSLPTDRYSDLWPRRSSTSTEHRPNWSASDETHGQFPAGRGFQLRVPRTDWPPVMGKLQANPSERSRDQPTNPGADVTSGVSNDRWLVGSNAIWPNIEFFFVALFFQTATCRLQSSHRRSATANGLQRFLAPNYSSSVFQLKTLLC